MDESDKPENQAPRRVVGVHYSMGDAAPTVVVKGAGSQVDAVLASARGNSDQTVVRDPALLNELYRIPIDGPVTSSLFPVMATLLVHVLERDRRAPA
jgi:type III secretion system FlhB-like substrate exporter